MKKKQMTVWPGEPYPLGATWNGEGVNFSIFSENAEKVELCLFDSKGRHEIERIALRWQTDQIFHCYLPDARPDQLYGYRVHGPYEPERGHRFNHHKLLLDPYAKALWGEFRWSDALFGYRVGNPRLDLVWDKRDSAAGMPKCRVVETAFSWGDDRPPCTPWHETIIYEVHVKGFTYQHPEVQQPLRGTYAGLASYPSVEYLKRLGITAVELMPVHAFVDERHLVDRGLKNYWGYNSIGFLAPEMRYSATGLISEFKTMVKTLHSAGIEVILDVVYNHTAEGNHLGPTFCFRGIDNASYYRLMPDDPRYFMDFTGCGNTLNMRHPRVLQLIMDSLRYWVLEMHVDGFRFDLASALARELHEVDRLSAFFDIIHQDPILSQVKLIAEPWDLGEGGYQIGNFPIGWTEWNGIYRDMVRAYWKGDDSHIGEIAHRLTGSSDLYEKSGRRPYASINFITCHDGFTLNDLVSYDHKHNEANLEDNRDGSDHNLSWNCGVEGPSEDPAIMTIRARQKRNFMATLLLSQGVPMILSGDEIHRSQNGNNNSYCQDSELSWQNWQLDDEQQSFFNFVCQLIALRKSHPAFCRQNFFLGRQLKGAGIKDIIWLQPHGTEMTDEEWGESYARCLGMYLDGDAIDESDSRGNPILDCDHLLLFNAHHEQIDFQLTPVLAARSWQTALDTAASPDNAPPGLYHGREPYALHARSLVWLLADKVTKKYTDKKKEKARKGV